MNELKEIIKEKLKPGMVIKNYKELCSILGISYLGGCAKNAQMKDLSRYMDYVISGQKVHIEKIHDEPDEIALIKISVTVNGTTMTRSAKVSTDLIEKKGLMEFKLNGKTIIVID